MARTAVGYFDDRRAADAAFQELVQRGFARDDISIVGRGAEDRHGLADGGDHATAGGGAALGGVTGLLMGVAAMLIPGIGPLVAVGPIAAALAGAVTGGVTGAVVGGVAGALIHHGVSEEDARYYEERFKQGGVLMTVSTPDESSHATALQVLARHGADTRRGGAADGVAPSPTTHGTAAAAAAANPLAASRDVREQVVDEAPGRLELHEERLVAEKEMREVGAVRVHTEVEEVPAHAEAEVLREQLRLQHVPVNEVVKDRVLPWEEDETYIVLVYEERLVLT